MTVTTGKNFGKFLTPLTALALLLCLSSLAWGRDGAAGNRPGTSPAYRVASGGGEHDVGRDDGRAGSHAAKGGAEHGNDHFAADLAKKTVNFIVFCLLIYFLARKPLKDFLLKRHHDVVEALAEATRERDEAEAKLKEYADLLSRVSVEVEALRGSVAETGRLEREKIIEEGKEQAERIVGEARKTAEGELLRAREVLRQEMTELAVEFAKTVIREKIDKKDQNRLFSDFLQKVREMNVN